MSSRPFIPAHRDNANNAGHSGVLSNQTQAQQVAMRHCVYRKYALHKIFGALLMPNKPYEGNSSLAIMQRCRVRRQLMHT